MPVNFNPETAVLAREQINAQKSKYREEYLDDEYWKELAREIGVRLPMYYARPSDQEIKFWLKTCGVSYNQFVDAFGWKDAEEFERLNPTHGMKIIAGLILELKEENRRIRKIAMERVIGNDAHTGTTPPPKPTSYRGKSKARRRKEDKSEL